MKKLLAIVLSFITVMTASSAVMAEEVVYKNADVALEEFKPEHTDVFVGLGIVTEEFLEENMYSQVTRGDFAKMLAYLLNYESGITDFKGTYTYFEDVDIYHYAAGSIHMLLERGIVSGCGDGMFYPDRVITAEEAAAMLIRAMGYGIFGDTGLMDDPSVRTSAKIQKGIYGELNYRQCFELLYNALFESTITMENLRDSELTYSTGDIFLKEIMKLDYYDGVLQAVGGRSILDNEAHNDEVIVDGYSFRGGSAFSDELLGFRVRVFYSDSDEGYKAVAIERLANEVLTIDTKSYHKYLDNSLSYVNASGRIQKVKLINQKDVVYNTGVVDDIESHIPKYGEIKLINNNSDSNYEVVLISGYESGIVSGISPTNEIIQFKNRNAIDLADYEITEIVDENGKERNFADIKENDTVCIYTYNDYIRIEISSRKLTGSIDDIETDLADWTKFVIDGSEIYAYSDYYSRGVNFKPGQTVTLLIDAHGRIAGMLTEADGDWKVGVVLSARISYDDAADECVSFKLLNQNGRVERINTTESVRIDGVRRKNMEELLDDINNAYQDFKPVGSDDSENVTSCLMRYFINEDGKISKIDTPTKISLLDYKGASTTEDNKLLMRVKGRLHRPESGYKFKVDSPGRVDLAGEVEPSTNSIAFVVPEDSVTDPDESEDYSVTTIQALKEEQGGNYYISAYNYVAESLMTDVLVIRKSAGSNTEANMMIVDSLKKVYNEKDDEIVMQISGYANAKAIEYVINEKSSTVDINAIEQGDVLSYKVMNDEITLVDMIWNREGKGKLKAPGIYSNSGTYHYYAPFRVLLGKIKRTDGKLALLDLGENEFGSDLFTLPTSVIVYDTKGGNNPFYISENLSVLTELSGNADTVLVAQGKRGGVKCMIVIKD